MSKPTPTFIRSIPTMHRVAERHSCELGGRTVARYLITVASLSVFACGESDGTLALDASFLDASLEDGSTADGSTPRDGGPGDGCIAVAGFVEVDEGRSCSFNGGTLRCEAGRVILETGGGRLEGNRLQIADQTLQCTGTEAPSPCSPACGGGQLCKLVRPVDGADVDPVFTCVAADTGNDAVGDACNFSFLDGFDDRAISSCDENALCSQATEPSRCVAQCGNPGSCEPSELCGLFVADPEVRACRPASLCDPVQQTGCDAGEACYVFTNTTGDWVGTCIGAGPLEADVACDSASACRSGSDCLRPIAAGAFGSGAARCRTFCDPDASNPECSGSQTCTRLPLGPSSNFLTPSSVGVCQ